MARLVAGVDVGGTFTDLVLLGRWSLSYYLLHQPVMLGLLAGVFWSLG